MKELTEVQRELALQILGELIGLTMEQAKAVLKFVAADLERRAVIRGVNNE